VNAVSLGGSLPGLWGLASSGNGPHHASGLPQSPWQMWDVLGHYRWARTLDADGPPGAAET